LIGLLFLRVVVIRLINFIDWIVTAGVLITALVTITKQGREALVKVVNYFTGYVHMEKVTEDSDIKKLNNLVQDIDKDRKEIKEEFQHIKEEFVEVKDEIKHNRDIATKGYVSGLKRDIVNNFDYWRMMEAQLRDEGLNEHRIAQAKQRVKDEISNLFNEYKKYGGNYNISKRVEHFLDDKEEY